MLLQFQDVVKHYPTPAGVVRALDGVSLTLEPGDFAAVRGPSGCGKSTLLLAAGTLQRPDSGRVLIEGSDPYALAPEQRARFRAAHVGFVFQMFHLVPYLDVRRNILAAALALDLTRAEAAARADALIERLGLGSRATHVPSRLSTGERQRVAIARALLGQPKLLLADEPTGNLDTANAEAVMEHLSAFAQGGGAVLLVTHDPRAARYARRVFAMEHGKIQTLPAEASPAPPQPVGDQPSLA